MNQLHVICENNAHELPWHDSQMCMLSYDGVHLYIVFFKKLSGCTCMSYFLSSLYTILVSKRVSLFDGVEQWDKPGKSHMIKSKMWNECLQSCIWTLMCVYMHMYMCSLTSYGYLAYCYILAAQTQ